MFDSVTKKIKEMKEKNIINENESIGNIFVKGYMDSIVKAAKEKGVNVTKDELYFYFVFKPIQENFEIFKEAVMKITGMDEETLERNMFEIQAPEELEKDQKIKGLESFLKTIDIYNVEAPSMLFSTGQADKLKTKIAEKNSVFFFSMENFLKKNPSVSKDYVFNEALKLNLNDFIEKNVYGDKETIKEILKEFASSLREEYGIENFAVIEKGDIALPVFYLKNEYLKKFIERLKIDKADRTLVDKLEKIINYKEKIFKEEEKYIPYITDNGYFAIVREKDIKDLEKENVGNVNFDKKLIEDVLFLKKDFFL